MKAKPQILLLALGVLAAIAVVLWWPYETRGIPMWSLQVVDRDGEPLPNVQVNQEWLDPIDEGMTFADVGHTDTNGFVVFPKWTLHSRLAFGLVRSKPSSHVFVCWKNQYADVDWDGVSPVPPKRIVLKTGSCPYG